MGNYVPWTPLIHNWKKQGIKLITGELMIKRKGTMMFQIDIWNEEVSWKRQDLAKEEQSSVCMGTKKKAIWLETEILAGFEEC